ncbi:hypothetical protein BDW59DRAFT_160447 [Aspergillus cavernicola]|uniref:NmrA-like domain-containing protein n=1 Tax=Aspergillus cavernicola TaxID=176166 RepID=A0ABR4IHW1_9EURO
MLILIVGITGALGRHLALAAFARNYTVRGLGRSPKSLAPDIESRLESFIELQSYYDMATMERACYGVDAIICALRSTPELELDAQILLLRAAEKAGVKTFVASTWNNDWTRIQFGDWEHYDAHISFKRLADMTSQINPVYLFIGTFAEYLYEFTCFPLQDKEDNSGKELTYWENPDMELDWTSMRDGSEFTLEILNKESVKQGEGGCFSFRSGVTSPKDLALTYEKVKKIKVELVCGGSETELEALAVASRKDTAIKDYFIYAIYFYHLFILRRSWSLVNLEDLPEIRRTSLEEVVAALE